MRYEVGSDSTTLLAPLGAWFETHRRALPWRDEDLERVHPNPYAVLVSELMLQQTQVATVIPFFERWLARFPDLKSLARASDDEVHKMWEGLGYYRRARHLQASAKRISEHGWPQDFEGLMQLPGLGPYTAGAVASIAFQWPEPALDGNAFRVLARLLGIEGDPKSHAKELREWLRPALKKLGPSRITQGLMELGATVCVPTPKCPHCPLAAHCVALQIQATNRIPPVVKHAQPKASEIWIVAMEAEGRWLLREPAAKGLLAGLWRWPVVEGAAMAQASLTKTSATTESTAADSIIRFSSTEVSSWPGWTQVYTHRREQVTPVRLQFLTPFKPPEGMRWIETDDLDSLALGKRDQRLRELLKTAGLTPLEYFEPEKLLARILQLPQM